MRLLDEPKFSSTQIQLARKKSIYTDKQKCLSEPLYECP